MNDNPKENNNYIRLDWSFRFFFIAVIFLVLFLGFSIHSLCDILMCYLPIILWCSSCAAVGISLGLYNSRTVNDNRSKEHRHYYTYFFFAWFMAALAAFIAFGKFENNIVMSYAASAFVGISFGFVADKLGDIFTKQ